MAHSDQKHEKEDREVRLNLVPGSGDMHTDNICNQEIDRSGRGAGSCRDDKNHRKLAICSIICGLSCIGIVALINSVKAEETRDPERAAKLSKRARKFGIISIVTWLAILALVPILMGLISYLLTLQD